jgi:hypothetical protein
MSTLCVTAKITSNTRNVTFVNIVVVAAVVPKAEVLHSSSERFLCEAGMPAVDDRKALFDRSAVGEATPGRSALSSALKADGSVLSVAFKGYHSWMK